MQITVFGTDVLWTLSLLKRLSVLLPANGAQRGCWLSKLPTAMPNIGSADSRGHSRLHNPAPNRKPVGLSGPLESVALALGLDGLQSI